MKKPVIALFAVSLMLGLAQCKHEPIIDGGPDSNGNGNPPDSGQPCDPDSVYFEPDVLSILTTSCAFSGCHDAATASEGIVLTSYSAMLNSDDKLVDSNLSDNELWEVINDTDPDKVMPPPPNNPLTAAQKQTIQTWILQGAQNNSCGDCDSTKFAFAADIQPLIQTNCTGPACHSVGGAGGFSLTTHSDVVDAVMNRNLVLAINYDTQLPGNKWMPPGNQLDRACIAKIEQWVNNGMPND